MCYILKQNLLSVVFFFKFQIVDLSVPCCGLFHLKDMHRKYSLSFCVLQSRLVKEIQQTVYASFNNKRLIFQIHILSQTICCKYQFLIHYVKKIEYGHVSLCLYCRLGTDINMSSTTDNCTSIPTNPVSTVNNGSTEKPPTGIFIFV